MTGKILEMQAQEVATLETREGGGYLWVEISVGGTIVVKFPLDLSVDSNEVALRTMNVINQTGVVSNSVEVVMD